MARGPPRRTRSSTQPGGTPRSSLLYADLNDFKLVNDELGHQAGDELLRPDRPPACATPCPPGAALARQGGDEFLVLLEDLEPRADEELERSALLRAEAVAGTIRDALLQPFTIQHAQFEVGASVGASIFPFDATDADTLHRYADQAMYHAKSGGQLFAHHERRRSGARSRASPAPPSCDAIDRDELSLSYQPIFRLPDRHVIGVEALVRWPQADGLRAGAGRLPAGGRARGPHGPRSATWVLETVIRTAGDWNAAGLRPNFGINLAPHELRDAPLRPIASPPASPPGTSAPPRPV